MKKVALYYDEIYLEHKTPLYHPESPSRLSYLMGTLRASELWPLLLKGKPVKATFEHVALVHTDAYIERLKNARVGHLDPDTYLSERSLEAALYAVGALIDAVDKVKGGEIERAFCAVRPPGHHAERHKAMGFCIFNNVAIGARYAQTVGYHRVFIIDFDVHHGNGTQHIFEQDDSVFFFSTHQYPHYPGTGAADEKGKGKGEGFTYNVPVEAGAGDKTYSKIYNEILPPLVEGFKPDIIFVSAGYDIHKHDPLSVIKVSNDGIADIVKGILRSSDRPYIFALEGGYNIPALEDSVKATLKELLYTSRNMGKVG
jgi:acetoin utilization deacetylase AcuC-like enzyme